MTDKFETRLLHVTPWFPPQKGGLAQYVSNLCMRLGQQGYGISVLSAKRWNKKPYNANVEYVNCIYLPGWPYPTLRSVCIPIDAGAKINSILKKGNYDLIHVHGIHYPLCWLSLYLARRSGIPSVLSLHGTYALNPNVMGGETKVENLLYGHLFSRIMAQADAVIGLTEGVTNFARKGMKSRTTTFYTVEHGLDTTKYKVNIEKKSEFRRKYNIDKNSVVLLFTGRFERVKGVVEFCRAVKKVVNNSSKKVEILVVGAGSLKEEVYSILQDVSGAHLFEWQPEEEIHQFYIASDIFVMPSRFEGLPLTVLEAMNSGLHIVYTPVGGVPDILKGYFRKTILGEISEQEIYDAVMGLVARQELNVNLEDSLAYARQFDWNSVTQRILSIYNDVLDNTGR